ncbi:MAG TPA: Asp-tRNA(Asn)/Glu-tRNA(Gln) amidotransferase subunit GatC [Armatimonadota bacterium]|nr:Asp-tRNA(Asn)/Glu-tRNA(Gln) amidotransferase subunit GatC [Armatimonadota bacterium]
MEQVTKDDVAHVAVLAHLDLSEEEIARLQRELNRILEHFAELQQLDTDGVEPMSHAVPMVNVLREDEIKASLPIDEIVSNAPDGADEFFRVPRIVEG